LEVLESSILATGTADPLADTRTQSIIELPENSMNLPIDRLETFDPIVAEPTL